MNLPPVPDAGGPEPIDEIAAVPVFFEDRLPTIATCHDVIHRARIFESEGASHAFMMPVKRGLASRIAKFKD